MQPARNPDGEDARLESLRRLDVLDTPREERFDRITRLAAHVAGTEIALVSLVDRDRQWFKSSVGLDVQSTSRDASFCAHAILDAGPMVVEDATDDPRFADNPLVTGAPNIRMYVGHPIHAPDGAPVGTLCVIGRSPGTLDPATMDALRDLAALVEIELDRDRLTESERELRGHLEDARRRLAVDPLTRMWNRPAIERLVRTEYERAKRNMNPLAIAFLDVDHFKSLNDTHGHLAGDVALREVAARIRRSIRSYDACGRWGGEEFVIVMPRCDLKHAMTVAERVRAAVAQRRIDVGEAMVPVRVSIGVAACEPDDDLLPRDLVHAADTALLRAKSTGRDQVVAAESVVPTA